MTTREHHLLTRSAHKESVIIQLSIFAKVWGVNSIFQKLNEGPPPDRGLGGLAAAPAKCISHNTRQPYALKTSQELVYVHFQALFTGATYLDAERCHKRCLYLFQ